VKSFDNWSGLCIVFGFAMRIITRPFSPVDPKLIECVLVLLVFVEPITEDSDMIIRYAIDVIDKIDVNSALRDYGGDESVVMSHWYGVHAFLLFQLGKTDTALDWALAGLAHAKRYTPPVVIQPMVLYCIIFIHHVRLFLTRSYGHIPHLLVRCFTN